MTVRAAEGAAEAGARLLLLPECSLTGADWPTGERSPAVEEVALELDSAPVRAVAECAGRTGIVIAFGLYEKRPSGSINVTQAFAGPGGLLGAYRKAYEGSRSSTEADRFPVFDLGFARVGVSICYDNMFPECARMLALKGAEVLLSPFTSLPLTREAWEVYRLVALRARAQDNRMFVLSASHARPHVDGRPAEWGYSGICCAVDPQGRVLAVSEGEAGTPQSVTVELPEELTRTYALADHPAIRNRRPSDYRILADDGVQESYLENAPPFEMNLEADWGVAAQNEGE
jgi:predicted amidohydrolase